MKRDLFLHIKNSFGPKLMGGRKVVVILVDDYGSVRLSNKEARDNLLRLGFIKSNRFDHFDSLESADDLTELFEILHSVKDDYGNPAVISPMTLTSNIDFDAVEYNGFDKFRSISLRETYDSIDKTSHAGVWRLWEEGIRGGFFVPQFHGKQHLNVSLFNDLLNQRNQELIQNIRNRSFVSGTLSNHSKPWVKPLAAFDFESREELEDHKQILKDGLDEFYKLFGFRAKLFTAPGDYAHPSLERALASEKIELVDSFFAKRIHEGRGRFSSKFRYLGKRNRHGQTYIVRNAVFEPLLLGEEYSINQCMNEIKVAFQHHKPAILSSHRVNFSGHIDPKNRTFGLSALKRLLSEITARWPVVEFVPAERLTGIFENYG